MLKAKKYNQTLFAFLFLGIFAYKTYQMINIPLPPKGGIFFYSNQNYPLQRVVSSFIHKANKSIDIECFMITDPTILGLLKKKSLSLPVSIYHHRHHPKVFSSFNNTTITPSHRSALMHKKLIMIDEEYLLIGSTNLTETSLLMHENFMIGFHHKDLATSIKHKEAYYLCKEFHFYQIPKGKKEFLRELLSLIEKSEKSISVVMFCLSHKAITEALYAAKERGVKVEVILDGHTYDAGLDALFPTFRIRENHLMHHKFALIDEKILIFGSANWTKGGLSSNEEIEVIFHETPPSLLRSIDSLFKSLHKKAQNTIDQNKKREKKA